MARPKFSNPWHHEDHGILDILKWKFKIGPQEQPLIPEAPDEPAAVVPLKPEKIREAPAKGWRVAWLGHASFLVQGCGLSILIDPVFSEFCAPFEMKSFRRRAPLPISPSDLPRIDVVLLTHGHYDHLDLAALKALPGEPRWVIAEGHADWLEKRLSKKCQEVAWHEKVELAADVTVMATPAQHFTARTPFDRNRGHWCGWLIEGGGCKVWHAGDSAYCAAFPEIGEFYGPIDFGMIPIGAYQPRKIMKPMHMNPEEAVQVFSDTRCRRAVGMHWGTFTLTDEPMQEPALRLRREMGRRGLDLDAFTAEPIGSQWNVTAQV
ncbi:MBL fold metallo-hydrolase [Luteolibacter pohnpeiensis]|nr:MBL fold metallo-hydrolase [Luteolibacter pohnpeiensis]